MSLLNRLRKRPVETADVRIEPPVGAVAASADLGTMNSAGWVEVGFGGAASRVKTLPRVTPITAQRHATVFTCCNVIAGDLSKIPLRLYQRDSGGVDIEVHQHAATYLLNTSPAPGVSAATMRFAFNYSFVLRGAAYAYAPRDGGGELELIETISLDECSVLRKGRERFYDFTDGGEVRRRISTRSMMHARYMAQDGWTGRSPIEVAAESVGLALAGQEAAARTASGGTTRAAIKMEDSYASDEEFRRNQKRVKEAITDPESNGWPIIGAQDDIIKLDLSATDQQLLQSRKFDREMIVGIYRVPPSKAQILEHGVKANGQQQALDYRTDCLSHWAAPIEQQATLSLLTEKERRAGLFFKHDYASLLEPTTLEYFRAIKEAVGGPFVIPDEGRAMIKKGPIAGGDRLYPPSNMTREESSGDDGKQKGDEDE
ncbi:MAG: phage portal protein [Pseudoruegeria sp.]